MRHLFHVVREGDADWVYNAPASLNWSFDFGFHLAGHFQQTVHTGCDWQHSHNVPDIAGFHGRIEDA